MGFMMLMKKISLLFLLISASLLSTSFAGRKLGNNMNKEVAATYEEAWDEASYRIHERLLRVNTKDYGKYDPAPTFVKPPFKLIPN